MPKDKNLIYQLANDNLLKDQYHQMRYFSYNNDDDMVGLLSRGKIDIYDTNPNCYNVIAIDPEKDLAVGGVRFVISSHTESNEGKLPFEEGIVNRDSFSKIFQRDFSFSCEMNKLVFYPNYRNIRDVQKLFVYAADFLRNKNVDFGFIITTKNRPRARGFKIFMQKHAKIISLNNIIFPRSKEKYEGQDYTILIVDLNDKINDKDHHFLNNKEKVIFEDLL
jgi:hypothetical protein